MSFDKQWYGEKYFEEARKESKAARYAAIRSYEQQRVKIIYNNAKAFIAKLGLIIVGSNT